VHCEPKIQNFSQSDVFFQAPNAPKLVFSRGFTPDLARGAYGVPTDLLVGWGRAVPSPYPSPLEAFGSRLGASVLRPHQ